MEIVVLLLAGSATALATGLGVIPVFMLGDRVVRFQSLLWGVTVGVMGVAAIAGLLLPAFDSGAAILVIAGTVGGVLFLLGSKRLLARHHVEDVQIRGSILVFVVLFVHSLPEGFAIGTAFASDTAGLSLFIFLAIAIQNIPEGTSLAIPMSSAGIARKKQFWSAVLTSAPQPIGAVLAFLLVEQFEPLLPISFAFAAGAMLALVLIEIVPQSFTRTGWPSATFGTIFGGLLMLVLAATLGV